MKRFGRNQKRRLKAQLAQTQTTLDILKRHLVLEQKHSLSLRGQVVDMLDTIRTEFNQYHPIWPQTFNMSSPILDFMSVRRLTPDKRLVECAIHLLKLDVWPDEYREAIGIRIEHKDEHAMLYLDNYRLTRSGVTIEVLSKQIAAQLDAIMRKGEK